MKKPKTTDSSIAMTGVQQAAAMLVAMGKEHAGKLIKHFKNEELRVLVDAAHTLPRISRPVLDDLVKRFEDEFSAGTGLMDSSDAFDSIINESFTPEEFSALISQETGMETSENADETPLWEAMEEIDSEEIVEFIQDEHPQTIALIFSNFSSQQAAELIALLDRTTQRTVLKRMLALGTPAPAALAVVERHLRERFVNNVSTNSSGEGQARVANLLNELDRTNMEELLGELETDTDPDNIAAVKSLLFRFEDMVNLDKAARSTIFDTVATDLVSLALRGVEPELAEAILEALGQRTRRMIESELTTEAAIKPEAIAKARREIASAAIKMSAEGKISMPSAQQAA